MRKLKKSALVSFPDRVFNDRHNHYDLPLHLDGFRFL